MDIKRFISAGLLFPVIAILLTFGTNVMIDVFISIVAILCLHEYNNAFSKKAKPIKWIGVLAALTIPFWNLLPVTILPLALASIIILMIFILFSIVIFTEMKYTVEDISLTAFGVLYIVGFLIFATFLRRLNNGIILLWMVIAAAWGSDIFAYLVGMKFGKHKFSKISPKKSLEGCFGGVIGAIVLGIVLVFISNQFLGSTYNYLVVVGLMGLLSIVGQIGDFAASSIKRFNDVKDFSELIPGHGGMLDRIDSVIFILPFAYVLFRFLLV